ncbi:hypothetical protein D9601_16075 [Sphingomonas sp. MA1305]|uniref:hypothetical protein n=1 Tax=Sphingomonas sp. MA1305 TaxID=2479204 RepID=UPI0018DF2B00|nr:hypothetical protein [Sphingomonas sp. MA1305]MBI0476870.1 hypothetical protein [Sphingomonas sp. MA1305]
MSPLLYLLLSLASGAMFAIGMVRAQGPAGPLGDRAVYAISWVLFGFGLVTAVEVLALHPASVPTWHRLLGHLYLPTAGVCLIRGLFTPRQGGNPTQRMLGWIVAVIGALDLLTDLYELVSRT